MREGNGDQPVSSGVPANVTPILHPDQPLDAALRYLGQLPLLPVVSRADYGKLIGVISQADALRRYREFGES